MEFDKTKIKTKIAISKIKEENDIVMENKAKSVFKTVITAIAGVILSTGVVFAGTMMYENIEKIWKEPEKYDFTFEITEEDKKQAISEEEAKKKATEYLQKIGLEKEVSTIGLNKTFFENKVEWNLGFKSGVITLDSKGNFKSLNIPSYTYKIPSNYGITRIEAREVAKQLLSKYNPNENDNEYELVALRRNMENDEESYIWYATFYKKYGSLLNQYEKIEIGWIPTVNGLYSLSIKNDEYENNEQKISKEEAIKIATEKDKEIEKRHNIESVEAEIGIDKMNTEVIYREKDIENYEKGTINFEPDENGKATIKEDAVFYKVDNRIRKVWEVTILYDYYKYKENGPERFVYYVDSTTGEIIGGDRWAGSNKQIQNLFDDPYNFIEK